MFTKKSVFISLITMLISSGGGLIYQSKVLVAKAISDHRIPNAQIIQLEGEIKIKRQSGQLFSPTLGTQLYPEDELITGKNSSLMLQCANLSIQSIDADQIQENKCVKEESKCDPHIITCPNRGDELTEQLSEPPLSH